MNDDTSSTPEDSDQGSSESRGAGSDREYEGYERPFTVNSPLTAVLDGTVISEAGETVCHDCGDSFVEGDEVLVWALRPDAVPRWSVLNVLCLDADTDHLFARDTWQATVIATVGVRSVGSDQPASAIIDQPTIEELSPPAADTGRDPDEVLTAPDRRTAAVPYPDCPVEETSVECPYCETPVGITATGKLGSVLLSCGHRAMVDLSFTGHHQ